MLGLYLQFKDNHKELTSKKNLFNEIKLSLISLSPFILFFLYINSYLIVNHTTVETYGGLKLFFTFFIAPLTLIPGIVTAIIAFIRTIKIVINFKKCKISIWQIILSFILSLTSILIWLYVILLIIKLLIICLLFGII